MYQKTIMQNLFVFGRMEKLYPIYLHIMSLKWTNFLNYSLLCMNCNHVCLFQSLIRYFQYFRNQTQRPCQSKQQGYLQMKLLTFLFWFLLINKTHSRVSGNHTLIELVSLLFILVIVLSKEEKYMHITCIIYPIIYHYKLFPPSMD